MPFTKSEVVVTGTGAGYAQQIVAGEHHVVSDAGVRVRNGLSTDIAVPWDAIAEVRSRHRTVPDKKPLLVDIRVARPLAPEVRHYYTGEQLDSSFAAFGLLVRGSPVGQMMGNFYLKVARPNIPARIFSDEPKALTWLRARK